MLEDLEYLDTVSSGVVKPGFMTADVTQECRSVALAEHHNPLRSVCLHQTDIAWAVTSFPSLPRRGWRGGRFFSPLCETSV